MSAPIIWIIFPAAVGIGLWFLQQKERLTAGLAVGVCLLLALLAWQVPIGSSARIGPLTINLDATLLVLGRRFILSGGDRYFLVLIYLVGAMWFFAAPVTRTRSNFVPTGMLFLAIMVAAQAVEPFLYAALLIEVGILLSVPMLASSDRLHVQGVQRFVVFQTLALPFILLAGWASGVVELNPSASPLLTQATLLLALGFAFWMAVFPFNTWIPVLMAQVHPYVGGFILSILFSAVFFLGLSFLDGYTWLRTNPIISVLLQAGGVATVVTGGVWAAFQTDLKRLLGYGVILEIGFALVTLSLKPPLGVQLFAVSLVPRLIGIAVWALGLASFERKEVPLIFSGVRAAIKKFPFASAAIVIAYFSTAGIPLLAGFPVRQVIYETLAEQARDAAILIFAGNLGFLIGGVRMLITMIGGEETTPRISESRLEIVLLVVGVGILLVVGLFPQVFLPVWLNLAQVFERLK